MVVRVGINGFGRIGRNILRAGLHDSAIEFVAVNDLADAKTLAHLLKYDSVLGILPGDSRAVTEGDENYIIVESERGLEYKRLGYQTVPVRKVRVLSEKDPNNLPWEDLGIDIVVESTGKFTKKDDAKKHLYPKGASSDYKNRVIITAPAEGEDLTIVMGVNQENYNPGRDHIVSNASCTTNCLAPLAYVLMEEYGIKRGLMTTIHSYTNDQVILDFPHKDLRRARAAGLSMIPTKTGAATAIGLVLPKLKGRMDGLAIRVPTPNVSLVDLVVELEKEVPSGEEGVKKINDTYRRYATEGRLAPYLSVSEAPLVSRDFNGDPHSCIFDPALTRVIDGKQVKVFAWYDNEWAYSCRVIDLIKYMEARKTA